MTKWTCALVLVGLFSCRPTTNSPVKYKPMTNERISFDAQLLLFQKLGYKLNDGIDRNTFLTDVPRIEGIQNVIEDFEAKPFVKLYYYLGNTSTDKLLRYTDNCIWYDIEFLDPSSQYKSFMERMGLITNGEIEFTDIEITTDSLNYEWIKFKANEAYKEWKLQKKGYIADSYFNRFAKLTKELGTKGKYTYFDDGGQQFVIDYATPDEQKQFIKSTGLMREWLGEGNHFSQPID
jgi:hypothetical protein